MKPLNSWITTVSVLAIALLAVHPSLAQDPDVSLLEAAVEVFSDIKAASNGTQPDYNGHNHHLMGTDESKLSSDSKNVAGDGHKSGGGKPADSGDADRTATIAGSLLMVFIVGVGLIIAFVLNIFKKKMDDQLHLEV
ncbi:uncharacterized protein LOC110845262 [Folsomia candida]|uniref:uncharacterized protein LOC110845262 n=1 Tax=Folsomia candida TaxID=158441 RepID=UPI000B8F44E0|nr:uncharacterized protein LOC110845262 [Folsomia candida]XP_021947343.1 uncharacterized protein LOC110845262 [Folsomia candida]XP_021947344.1 uncharacterized protein LOC110845262 [Folsomia candida]XP_021947345.1 uncharacterized protein LOC110845262 [Folsomia candida]XP_035703193.1 uncharacterized protein LOC110845262 [Folsomia candida]